MLRHHQDATIAQLWAWVIKEACYKVGQGSGEPSSFQIDNYSGAQAEVSSESGHTFQVECFELPEDYVAALAHSNVTTAL